MPQARMYVGTRIVSEEPRSLYAGDIIDGALAAEQVAAGNAEYLPEPEASASELDQVSDKLNSDWQEMASKDERQ